MIPTPTPEGVVAAAAFLVCLNAVLFWMLGAPRLMAVEVERARRSVDILKRILVPTVGAGHSETLGAFLAAHPNARRFVEAPKPIPTSFTREAFFAVTSFKFTNAQGGSRHGRFRIRPEEGTEYLSDEQAAAKSADFLFDEIGPRLASGPVLLGVFVQLADERDDLTDSSVPWPEGRTKIPFGTSPFVAP